MTGRAIRWLVLPAILLPLAWLLIASLSRSVPVAGDPAPEFDLVAIDGTPVTSESLRGRPYLLNFWASWCIPSCVDEHPVLLEAQQRYGDRLRIVGVLYRDTAEQARDFLATYGDGGWLQLADPGERLAGAWGVLGPPESYLVDASGTVVARKIGPLTSDQLDGFIGQLDGIGS
ncbi:MAG TPA: redoxin family protein [Candidatus Limnocylindrales bacterium]|nr:redoxin family protein [Candidatus Limnocylindrales bacterium]